jgi:uncharacterized protein YjbJ (UPF0337 family)
VATKTEVSDHGQRSHQGIGQQAKGVLKEAVGNATGDAKLEVEGRNEKAAGKVQNAVGGVKDAMRDALKK